MPDPSPPPRPRPPEDYDCCGGGCADCELRLYYQRLADWQKRMRELGLPVS